MNTQYSERQKFNKIWASLTYLILLGSIVLILVVSDGAIRAKQAAIIINLALVGIVISLLLSAELTTKINTEQIVVYWTLFNQKFLSRTYTWDEVKSAEIITYGFVGFGYRISAKYGTVYNTKGSQGLHLRFNDGGQFLIGTNQKEQLQEFLIKNQLK